MDPGELGRGPATAVSALTFAVRQTVEAALPKYHVSALGRLGRAEEAETKTRRAHRTGQNRLRPAQPEPHGRSAADHHCREQGPRHSEGTHRTVSAGILRRDCHAEGYGATGARQHVTLTHQQTLGTVVKHVKENSMIT
ncbi:hypothetical protein GCM10010232_71040 [Streptomyces amakusaensis]